MIIIKNYEMPHNCYDCDIHNYHECNLTSESIEDDYCWNGDSREKHCPLREVEAIPKANYEARLKADMVTMLTDIQLEIEETVKEEELIDKKWANGLHYSEKIIQQKINALKEKEND